MTPRPIQTPAGTLIDLFAGCGGGSLGFRKAGLRPVAAVEIDRDAADAYEANIGVRPIVKDIRKVKGEVRVPETRFALYHAAALYSWMRPPSTSRRRTRSRATTASDSGGGSPSGGCWWSERWGRCSL